MEQIIWTDYLAANNPQGVNLILQKYGYEPLVYHDDVPAGIAILQDEIGIDATIDLIKQHPDYDIIVDTFKQSGDYHNATGFNSVPETKTEQVASDQPIVVDERSRSHETSQFSSTLQNVVLVVMAFWLINKIISK